MKLIFQLLYNCLALPLLGAGYVLAACFHAKTRDRLLNARKSLQVLDSLPRDKVRVWFHAASMGEFEQLKAIIELFRQQQPDVVNQIITSTCSHGECRIYPLLY